MNNKAAFNVFEQLMESEIELTARNHFISFLYKIFLNKDINLKYVNKYKKETDIGYLKWFNKCLDNLIEVHKKIYKEYF